MTKLASISFADVTKESTFNVRLRTPLMTVVSSHSPRQVLKRRVRLPIMLVHAAVRITRFALALALSLWIAGAGCMLGCGNMTAAAQPAHETGAPQSAGHLATIVSGDACPSSKSHDCCAKKTRAKSKTTAQETSPVLIPAEEGSSGSAMGCPLAINSSAVISKTSGKQIVSLAAVSTATPLAFVRLEQSGPLSAPPRLPNRGHTYLHCCVFLI